MDTSASELTHAGSTSTDLTLNTNDNSYDYSSSPLQLKVIATVDTNPSQKVNEIMDLYVYPDCSQETVSAPVVFEASVDYTIYDSSKTISINPFTVSRAYCVIETYTPGWTNTSAIDFMEFDEENFQFNIFTEDN